MSDRLTREFSAQLSTTMDSTLRRAMYEIMKIFETSLHDHLMELVQRGEEIANLKIKLQRAEIKLGERLCGGETGTEMNEKQMTEPQSLKPEDVQDASGHTSHCPEIDFEVPSDWCAPLGAEAVPKREAGLCPSVRLRKLHIPLWQVPIKKEVDDCGIDSHQQTVGGRRTRRGSSLQKHRHTMSVQRTHRGPVRNDITRLLQDIREEYTNLTDTPRGLRRGRRSQTGRQQEKGMEIIGEEKQTAKTKFKSTEQKSVENDSHKIYTCKFCKKKFQTIFGLSVHARSHKKCQGCKKEFSFPSYLSSHKLYCAKLKELLAKQAESTDPPKHQPCVGEAAPGKERVINKDNKALAPSKKMVTKKEDNTPSSQSKKRVTNADTPSPPRKQQAINKKDDTPSSSTKKQVIIKVEKLPLSCGHGESSAQKDGHTNKHTSSFSNQKDESICQMREHMRVRGGKRPFRCSICSKKFRFRRSLKTHMTKVHKDQVKTSQTNAILSWTLPLEKTEENQEVLISPGKDPSQASNRNNVKRKPNHNRKPGVIWKEMGTLCPDGYTCLKCPKVTKTKYLLIAHFRSHTGEKPFTCDHCAAKFRCVWQRNNHKKKCTGILFQCEKCEKKFPSKTKYDKHVIKNHRDWRLFCKICGKGFVLKGRLKNHMRSHNEASLQLV